MQNNLVKVAFFSAFMPLLAVANDNHTTDQSDIQHNQSHQDEHHNHEYEDEHSQDNHEDHHDDHHQDEQQIETIQVKASRLGLIVTESATRTEVIHREEIREKMYKQAGSIQMLVAETGGVRVQTTSPSLGSANIKLQGLFGRYTQLLSDGLPLYGNQASSLGLLQIPPTDLAGVEIIKGAASSLYGGSALGGVINLISRTPNDQRQSEILLNVTSRGGQDLTSYFASPISDTFSASITSGIHHQQVQDFDDDGWIDMAGYERASVRPRLYWQSKDNSTLYVTFGAMKENREGGTKEGAIAPDGNPFPLDQDTLRVDLGFVFDTSLTGNMNLNVRGSAMRQDHEHQFGVSLDDDTHESYLIESSLSGYSDNTAWLLGAAVQTDRYRSDNFAAFDYTFETPGIFSQVDYEVTDDISASLSARVDWHSEYGTKFSPRVSLLYHPENWVVRAAHGKGYFAPTPFTEEIDEVGLSRLIPLSNIEAEQATTSSLDISYLQDSLETSMTVFSSEIEYATELETVETGGVRLVNVEGETDISGVELLLRYKWRDIKFIGSYLYTDATTDSNNGLDSKPLALTPQHIAGLVIMWEQHGSYLVGFEVYYTGTQRLENNPYREKSNPYWHLGLLGQKTFGNLSVFVNAENILNVRQTRENPILLSQQTASGRWTTDIWSRNDGLVFNAGIRYVFGN